jgi:DUF1680 family protein
MEYNMQLKYNFLPAGAVKLKGILGDKLNLSIANRLKKIDYDNLVAPFKYRSENDNRWRGEFWGKVVRSAINSYYSTKDEELLAIIKKTVQDIISCQSPDGCISSYPDELQANGWDIWGRKYVLLGLLRYYDVIEKSEQVKNCCIKMLEHIMTQMGPNAKNIADSCNNFNWGLPPASILGAVVGVWRISGDDKFLDYAKWIIDSGCCSRHDIFHAVDIGLELRDIAGAKAYEMMSCFQGMAELSMEKENPSYNDTVLKFYNKVRSEELFITGAAGTGSSGEFWGGGVVNQTGDGGPLGRLGETCVTVTWIHYCDRILRLLGEESTIDELEKVFYNALAGAMVPDGSWWIHDNPTPLTGNGSKIPAADQMEAVAGTPYGHDCCVAQGPEGLAFAPLLAALEFENGIAFNFYEDMAVEYHAPNGEMINFDITGNYPLGNDVNLKISCSKSNNFAIKLHIPEWWNENCKISLPDGSIVQDVIPGKYYLLQRTWNNGDIIRFHFYYAITRFTSKDDAYVAYKRGGLVLAADSRCDGKNISDIKDNFLVTCQVDGRILCDYISAGNLFTKENTLQVWFRK